VLFGVRAFARLTFRDSNGLWFGFLSSFFDNLAHSTALRARPERSRTGQASVGGVFEKFSVQSTFSIPEPSVFGPTGINVGFVSKLGPAICCVLTEAQADGLSWLCRQLMRHPPLPDLRIRPDIEI
jgi:hypothetical protein